MHGRTDATYPSCPGKGTAAPDKATVLLVEDDAIVRAWVGLALTHSEFSVGGEAPTMADGLELVSRRRGDVLLIDHRLTDGFGTEREHGRGSECLPLMSQPVFYGVLGYKGNGRSFQGRITRLMEAIGLTEDDLR